MALTPSRGSKRPLDGSSSASKPRERKPRLQALVAGVVDGIKQAEDLPEACRSMFTAVAPHCLAPAASERHKHQDELVSWIGEVLEGVRTRMQESLDEEEKAIQKGRVAQEAYEGRLADAKAVLLGKEEAVNTKQVQHSEASQAVVSAKSRLTEVQEAKAQIDAEMEEAQKEKDSLKRALEENVLPLLVDEGFEAATAKRHMELLLPVAKRLGIDDSLVLALPTAAVKSPRERGEFDNMVLKQLTESLDAGASKFIDTAALDTAAAALKEVQAQVLVAEETCQGASTALSSALEEQRTAAFAVHDARVALEAFTRGKCPSAAQLEAKKAALDNFANYNMQCFNVARENGTARAYL